MPRSRRTGHVIKRAASCGAFALEFVMKRILKIFAFALFLSSGTEARAQAEWFDGIWQNQDNPASYFSLHIEGSQVVLVDLATLERTGRTLTASYRGEIGTSHTGTPMATVRVITVHPDSQGSAEIFVNEDKTLSVYWCHQQAGGCVIGAISTLRKVF
jgi:hypothetical protein